MEITARTYLWTFLALLALAGLTFWMSYLDLGAWETPLAMLIAAVKAVLVALFFMHLIEQRATSVFAISTAVMFLAILVALVVADVATRAPSPIPTLAH
jgi:cytochrome c oxidase subunit 4